jgi:hypothetical protein
MLLPFLDGMVKTKVTQPVTDNKERALQQNRQHEGRTGGPSRAHSDKDSDHEKKPSRTAPKSGG